MRAWQLTRGQRVEMEAALASIRADVLPGTGCRSRGTYRAARVLCDASALEWWDLASDDWSTESWRLIPLREWRVLRARVAIALRAALRADEDARCEEVLVSVTWRLGHYHGARYAVDALREWPELSRGLAATVPLALWEGGG